MALSGNGRAYDAGRYDIPQMDSWQPGIGHPDNEINPSRDVIVARARDLARNNPNLSGAVNRLVEMVVGPNVMYVPQPNIDVMGKDDDWEDAWVTNTEAWFDLWAEDGMNRCDVAMQMQFGAMVALAYRHWVIDGEACAVVKMLDRGAMFQTAIQLIDPDRLSNPDGVADGMVPNGAKGRVYGGVEVNASGAPIAYHIRVRHPDNNNFYGDDGYRWERVARFGPTGRPQFIHAFRADRAEQRRGVSRLSALIKLAKVSEKLTGATLDTAILANFLAVGIVSPYPTSDVRDALAPTGAEDQGWSLAQQVAYREKNRIRLVGPQVNHYLPGEEPKLLSSNHPNDNYVDFSHDLKREGASAVGLSYAQYNQDYADINYSSGRLQGNEVWRAMLHERRLFTQMFCTPINSAWMEEAVLLGKVKAPGGWQGFYKWRAALVQADWMGPGRGTGNPLQEANANDIDTNARRTNLILTCAEQGLKWRKVLRGARKVEKAVEILGLDKIVPIKAVQPEQPDPADDGSDGGDKARQGDGKFADKRGKSKQPKKTTEGGQ
ncbi:phage portal protein [Sphingobium sp. HDIP04]|uniref:phage portal protein n=1 Tax=Sphingobium sp. HDIP04 TaxID=428994 RepID=UPI001EE750E3|nr:phage portal protein [Sphingobium sp. HDIP04]